MKFIVLIHLFLAVYSLWNTDKPTIVQLDEHETQIDGKVKGGKPAIIEDNYLGGIQGKLKGSKPVIIEDNHLAQIDGKFKGSKPIILEDNHLTPIDGKVKSGLIESEVANKESLINLSNHRDDNVKLIGLDNEEDDDRLRVADQDTVSNILFKAKQEDTHINIDDNIIAKKIYGSVKIILKEKPAHEWHRKDLNDRIDLLVHDANNSEHKELIKVAIHQVIKESPLRGDWNEDALIESIYDKIPSTMK
jgi:hypothetical protein